VKISIVIPTFNEAGSIQDQVRRCLALNPPPEVIVADAGSHDGTALLAQGCGAITLACTRRGRAHQMNAGAAAAGGDALIFLHADVLLPQNAYTAMQQALRDPALIGGAFRRRFDTPSLLLALGCRLADIRGRVCGIFLGDQAMFLRKSSFHRLGGFPPVRLFEDVALSRKMRQAGATRLLPEPVTASGRRFRREGNLLGLSRNLWLTLRYLTGADPESLARRYYPGYFEAPETLPAGALARSTLEGGKH
jgi:rSAM/selenodomain-associated transferase 2